MFWLVPRSPGHHAPQHGSPRMFRVDWIEKYLSRVKPWHVLIVWVPVISYLIYRGLQVPGISAGAFFGTLVGGVVFWTLLEYVLHRWVFHFTPNPNSELSQDVHFLIHGVHHDWPHDPDRLVMPPVMSILLAIVLGYPIFLVVGPRYFDPVLRRPRHRVHLVRHDALRGSPREATHRCGREAPEAPLPAPLQDAGGQVRRVDADLGPGVRHPAARGAFCRGWRRCRTLGEARPRLGLLGARRAWARTFPAEFLQRLPSPVDGPPLARAVERAAHPSPSARRPGNHPPLLLAQPQPLPCPRVGRGPAEVPRAPCPVQGSARDPHPQLLLDGHPSARRLSLHARPAGIQRLLEGREPVLRAVVRIVEPGDAARS